MSAAARTVVEASTLGWPAGAWPQTFERDGVRFYRMRKVEQDGELVAVLYRAGDGRELEVLND